MDIFTRPEVRSLLQGKTIVFMGGSIVRGLYKDFLWLLNSNTLIPYKVLGSKGEERCPDLDAAGVVNEQLRTIFSETNRDCLHCCSDEGCDDDYRGMIRGRNYVERREYYNRELDVLLIFRFIESINVQESWFRRFEKRTGRTIDMLLINSALWDINRWGPLGHSDYKDNLQKLMKNIPEYINIFYITMPPIAEETCSAGMNVPGLEFQNYLSKHNVINMNHCASTLIKEAGHNIVDLGFSLQSLITQRNPDGIHWKPEVNRLMTNKCLTIICLSFHGAERLPRRLQTDALDRLICKYEGRPWRNQPRLNEKSSHIFQMEVNNVIEGRNFSKMPNKEENMRRMRRRLSWKFLANNRKVVSESSQRHLKPKQEHPNNNNLFTSDIWETNFCNDSSPTYQHRNSLLPTPLPAQPPFFYPQVPQLISSLRHQMLNLQNIANTVIRPPAPVWMESPVNPLFMNNVPPYYRGQRGRRGPHGWGRGANRYQPYQ